MDSKWKSGDPGRWTNLPLHRACTNSRHCRRRRRTSPPHRPTPFARGANPLKECSTAAMASLRAVQKAATLPPTVRTLPSGVPSALHINLKTRAPADSHGHGHGHASSSRADAPRPFAQKSVKTALGLASKSYTTGEVSNTFQ